MSDQPNHVLIITVDQEALKGAQAEDPAVDPNDREFWNISTHCNADPTDYTRRCITWYQCDCQLSDVQRDDDWDNGGEGPCPTSPTGVHRHWGDISPAIPSSDCWARVCDESGDAAWWLVNRHNLGPGVHPVWVHPDHETVEFELAEPAQAVTS